MVESRHNTDINNKTNKQTKNKKPEKKQQQEKQKTNARIKLEDLKNRYIGWKIKRSGLATRLLNWIKFTCTRYSATTNFSEIIFPKLWGYF